MYYTINYYNNRLDCVPLNGLGEAQPKQFSMQGRYKLRGQDCTSAAYYYPRVTFNYTFINFPNYCISPKFFLSYYYKNLHAYPWI